MAAFCRSNEKKRKFSSDLKAKLETKPRNELVSDQHTTYIPYEKSRHNPNMEKVSHGPCVRNKRSSLPQKGQCLSVCEVLSSLFARPWSVDGSSKMGSMLYYCQRLAAKQKAGCCVVGTRHSSFEHNKIWLNTNTTPLFGLAICLLEIHLINM